MKTSATDISLANKLVNKMSEYSPEEILADVLKINQSGLTEENVDAIRICYMVKKLWSKRSLNDVPGSSSKIPGSETNHSVFPVKRIVLREKVKK